jgi:integrase
MSGLTDTEIKRAKAMERAHSMLDGGGLYLWVKPTGGEFRRWSHRFEGKEKLMSLGKYPDVSLALARDHHAEARMTGHGFGGLASTILHEQGYAHDHIELQLAHAPRNVVSAAYNHALYLEPRARMMQDWGDFLERAQRGDDAERREA